MLLTSIVTIRNFEQTVMVNPIVNWYVWRYIDQ
jgi:hypothetical protein